MNEGTQGTMIRNFIMEALWNDVEFRSKKLAIVSFFGDKFLVYSYKNIHIFMTHNNIMWYYITFQTYRSIN